MPGGSGLRRGSVCSPWADGVMPPTINLTEPEPTATWDYGPRGARTRELDVMISNSFGMGGRQPPTLGVKRVGP